MSGVAQRTVDGDAGAARRMSVNEVLRLARRVLIATGAGPGCEEEPAQAVTWLQARGLDGLAALHADLDALRRVPPSAPRVVRDVDGRLELQAHGASALYLLLDAVALVAAEQCPLSIAGARSPLWLAPCLALAAPPGADRWGAAAAAGETVLQVAVDARGAVAVHGGPAGHALHGLACDLTLGHGAPPPWRARWSLDASELDRRHGTAVREGVHAPAQVFAELAVVSRGALVPESERSRERGAGGGDDNA